MKDIKYTINVYAFFDKSKDEADTTFEFSFVNGNDKMHIDEIISYKVDEEMTKHPALTLCDWEVINVCFTPGQKL